MLSAKVLYLALPLFSLLGAGVIASNEPGAFQIPLDSAAPPIPLPAIYRIHPGYTHPSKCLDVKGAALENGTPVEM
jgi:hypothetical protein